jgi:type II secretory pathway component HofQ
VYGVSFWRVGCRAVWGLLGVWLSIGAAGANVVEEVVEKTYQGKPMSLDFQDIQVRNALMVIADFTGMNVVVSDSVTGSMTLRLRNVPWDQVLEIIVQAKGLSQKKQGNVIWVAPRAEVAAAEKLELESQLAQENQGALQTRGFTLNYAKATQVMQYLLA